ncbi:hypothetical protein BAGQ_2326 [Bacillus velezensis]|nr:hypothetical protein BCBMB205_22230 [Bacillus velezensis]ARZ58559.1 hypothetical protein BAGQ_2326 [Bacillus velezensis]
MSLSAIITSFAAGAMNLHLIIQKNKKRPFLIKGRLYLFVHFDDLQ